MKLFGKEEQETISRMDLKGAQTRLIGIVLISYGLLMAIFWILLLAEIISRDLVTICVTYGSFNGILVLFLYLYQVWRKERGIGWSCLSTTIRWAIKRVAYTFLYYRGENLKFVGKWSQSTVGEELTTKVQKYYKEALGEELQAEEKKKPTNDGETKQTPTEEGCYFVYHLNPIKAIEVGYDENAQTYRPWQSAYIYCPDATYDKHFPNIGDDVIFEEEIIRHEGAKIGGHLDCIGWTEDPETGNWEPHFRVTESEFFGITRRNGRQLSSTDDIEKIAVMAQVEEMGKKLLGLHNEMVTKERKLDEVLTKKPQDERSLADREHEARDEAEKRLDEDYVEKKLDLWKWFGIGMMIFLLALAMTKAMGVW